MPAAFARRYATHDVQIDQVGGKLQVEGGGTRLHGSNGEIPRVCKHSDAFPCYAEWSQKSVTSSRVGVY